jgi:hypothetical protein
MKESLGDIRNYMDTIELKKEYPKIKPEVIEHIYNCGKEMARSCISSKIVDAL